MPKSLSRRARRIGIAAAAVSAAIVLVAGMFPWGLFAGTAVRPLSAALGREVTIGSARRLDWFSFHPTIDLRDVTIAQPAWAGRGPMARIAHARLRFPVLPLLIGRFRPAALDIDGVRLALRRDAGGRANWEGDGKRKGRHGDPRIGHLTIANGTLTLVDLRRHVTLGGTLASDPARGLTIDGRGTDRGLPMTLRFRGGALGQADPDAPYPVRLAVASPLTRLDAAGRLDRPLDLSGMTVRVRASGRNLGFLDDYVQAGLFPSADYDLTGDLRRDGERWRLTGLTGRIGRSRLHADLDVATAARTRITGRVTAATLDFADFSSDAARARGRAKAAATGPRVLPDTRIVLSGLAKIDATIRLDAARLLSSGSPFRTLATVATLADRKLTLFPLRVGMVSGTMTGRAVDDDRGRAPVLSLDLRVDGATVQALFVHDQAVQGPFAARVRLTGAGDTVRAAIGSATGTIGFAVPSGTVRRDYATFLGGDLLDSAGAAIAGGDGRVAMRCLVGIFPTRGGVMTPDPLILDDVLSRGDGSGRITLSDERLDLALRGRSKHPGPLVSTAPVRIYGTLSAPQIDIRPPRAERTGRTTTLDRIGFFLKKLRPSDTLPGRDVAPDADCAALTRRALG